MIKLSIIPLLIMMVGGDKFVGLLAFTPTGLAPIAPTPKDKIITFLFTSLNFWISLSNQLIFFAKGHGDPNTYKARLLDIVNKMKKSLNKIEIKIDNIEN